MSGSLPPLPPGFELETVGALPPIPPGFEIEAAQPAARAERNPGWFPTAVARGVGGLIGLPRDIRDAVRGGVRAVSPSAADALERRPDGTPRASVTDNLPTGREVASAGLNALGIPEREAQTPLGRMLATGVEFGVGSALGGSLPAIGRNAALGAASGLTSGAAGEATRGGSLEVPARVAGALLPGAGIAAYSSMANRPLREAARSLEGLTPAQVAEAQALMREAEAIGSAITVPEAVQAVTGRTNRGLQASQDIASNSVGGSRVMAPFLDAREAGARTAATQAVEAVPLSPNAGMAPARIKDAAEAEIAAARRALSDTTQPLYAQAAQQAAEPRRIPQVRNVAAGTAGELRAMGTDNQVMAEVVRRYDRWMQNAFRTNNGAPQPMNWEELNDIRREMRDVSNNMQISGTTATDRSGGRRLREIERRLTANLHFVVPDLAAADRAYIAGMQTIVEPVERGLMGRVAATGNAGEQRGALFPRDPLGGGIPTQPADVAETFGRVAGPQAQRRVVGVDDLQAARDLLGAELRTRLDSALATRATGQPDRAGARIASSLAPTGRRNDTLDAAMRALPGGDQAADGLQQVLRVLEAQTYAPAANSATARRMEQQRNMGTVSLRPREWLDDLARNVNTESLARAITTPEGFHRLRAIAGLDNAARREQAIRTFLEAHRATTADEINVNVTAPRP